MGIFTGEASKKEGPKKFIYTSGNAQALAVFLYGVLPVIMGLLPELENLATSMINADAFLNSVPVLLHTSSVTSLHTILDTPKS